MEWKRTDNKERQTSSAHIYTQQILTILRFYYFFKGWEGVDWVVTIKTGPNDESGVIQALGMCTC